jgi:hypothetical protein
MENIILKAFELAGYTNASELAKVVSLTPNPVASAEYILGVYKEPVVTEETRYYKYKFGSNTMYYVERINKLCNTIHGYTSEPELIDVYVPKGEKLESSENCSLTNFPNATVHTVHTGELSIKKFEMNIDNFYDVCKNLSFSEYGMQIHKYRENQIPVYLRDIYDED